LENTVHLPIGLQGKLPDPDIKYPALETTDKKYPALKTTDNKYKALNQLKEVSSSQNN
jgi:hypothetical protein